MGMNYYLLENCCDKCGRSDKLHIGKSSWGWAFALHIDKSENLTCLRDWQERWSKPGVKLVDEEDREVSVGEMERIITKRVNVKRHDVDGRHCIAHGEGTYDLITGYFN